MSPIPTLLLYRELRRSQWLDRDRLRHLQEAKLRRLVGHAYATVPYYRRLFDRAGLAPGDVRSLEDLNEVPLTTKADLQAAGAEETTSAAFAADELVAETTSGSTGRPFTTRFDRRFVGLRNGLFLRALATAGYRPGRRLMLVTDDRHKASRRWLRWHYAPMVASPEELVAAMDRFRPWLLYGCVTPLRQMALSLATAGRSRHRPRAVVATAEALDDTTRGLLRDAFGAEVYDVYGLTEMGLIAWECPAHTGYHLAEDTAIVEYVPAPGGGSSLVMTNLELFGMPLIRFQTGDLGVPGAAGPCACGRSLARLERVEGRIVDSVRLRDGRTLSPYALTTMLERITGLERYQLVQEDFDSYLLRFEGRDTDLERTAAVARRAVGEIVGTGARIRVVRETNLDPPPGRKFRVVESRVASTHPLTTSLAAS